MKSLLAVVFSASACVLPASVLADTPAPAPVYVATQSVYTLRQTFFAAMAQGAYANAVTIGQHVLATGGADDEFTLNYAYALIGAGRTNDAMGVLKTLTGSSDPAIAAKAKNQLAAELRPTFTLFGYAQNEGRYGDTVYGTDLKHQWTNGSDITPYAVVHITDDTKSIAQGNLPQIYSDNAIVFSSGAAWHFSPFGALFAEAGYSQGIRTGKNFPETRAGAYYYRDFGPPDGPGAHTAAGGSIVLYSRFAGNTVGYGSLQHDVRIAGDLRAMAMVAGSFDSKNLWFMCRKTRK